MLGELSIWPSMSMLEILERKQQMVLLEGVIP